MTDDIKKSAFYNRLKSGLEEAIEFAHGNDTNVRIHRVEVPQVDAKAVRTKQKLSQTEFSERYGIPSATLRNWEQHRREPDAPARVLLAVIEQYPEIVQMALEEKKHSSKI
jgi:putative transcriptional regulator